MGLVLHKFTGQSHVYEAKTQKDPLRLHVAGLEMAGIMGICCQLTCLVGAIFPVLLLGDDAAAMHILAVCLVWSRLGLWTFDLAVSQMLQERVPAQEIGAHMPAHAAQPLLSTVPRSCYIVCAAAAARDGKDRLPSRCLIRAILNTTCTGKLSRCLASAA